MDHFGNRFEGEDAVRGNTPLAYRAAFYGAVRDLLNEGTLQLTSEEVRARVGMPPNHPSAVGALMAAAAKFYGLKRVGHRQAVGRHQHLLTLWSDPGIEVKME